MKKLEIIWWTFCLVFVLVGFYIGSTLAFMSGVPPIAWLMVVGGAWALGMITWAFIQEVRGK